MLFILQFLFISFSIQKSNVDIGTESVTDAANLSEYYLPRRKSPGLDNSSLWPFHFLGLIRYYTG